MGPMVPNTVMIFTIGLVYLFLPMPQHGSTDRHFHHLLLLILLHTSNFLFLLGTDHVMGGMAPSLSMRSCN